MTNPIQYVNVLTYINIVWLYRKEKNNSDASYLVGQKVFTYLIFNTMIIAAFLSALNSPNYIYIIIISICTSLFCVEYFRYFGNRKHYFKSTIKFLRKYKNEESLISYHYKIYVGISFLTPIILFIVVAILKNNNII